MAKTVKKPFPFAKKGKKVVVKSKGKSKGKK